LYTGIKTDSTGEGPAEDTTFMIGVS